MNYQLNLFSTAAPAIREDLAGAIPPQYAAILADHGLDGNRQTIAVRRLGEAARPSPQWFQRVCRELALDQASAGPKQGMMF